MKQWPIVLPFLWIVACAAVSQEPPKAPWVRPPASEWGKYPLKADSAVSAVSAVGAVKNRNARKALDRLLALTADQPADEVRDAMVGVLMELVDALEAR
jgi:hypothetical protein